MTALFSIKPFDFQMSLGNAALIALLGILIVFAVLAVLVGILTLFKLIFNVKITKKPAESNNAATTTVSPNGEDYDEIVAVISAALACMNEEEQVKAPFVIKSINKIK